MTRIDDDDPSAKALECFYPLIQRADQRPGHFLEGFTGFVGEKLGLRIELTELKGDLYLSEDERKTLSPVSEIHGYRGRYWLVAAGGKQDYTVKWWDQRRYQDVVDHFRGRIQFVQVGGAGDYHPELQGVIDLREQGALSRTEPHDRVFSRRDSPGVRPSGGLRREVSRPHVGTDAGEDAIR